jgi:hypothetical protein
LRALDGVSTWNALAKELVKRTSRALVDEQLPQMERLAQELELDY